MSTSAKYTAVVFCLLSPSLARAQSVGQVECPRGDGYVYLYSSMTTLDVRATLQCGEQVQITGRYDTYIGVRTAKGETGYVPTSSLLFLKDKPGAKAAQAQPRPAARPRTAYDEPTAPAEATPKIPPSASDLTLLNGTPVHLLLSKTISSASAHVGDVVDLQVAEDVTVDGLTVIPSGAKAVGIITEVEAKKRLGHGAKLGLSINFVRLTGSGSEKVPVRSFQDSSGSDTLAGVTRPVSAGKDVSFAQGTEFMAYVDGDVHLKREAFQAARDDGRAAPTPRP